MKIQRIVSLSAFALAVVFGSSSYHVTFNRPAVIAGSEIKAGDYKLELTGSKVTLKNGKASIDADVSVESSPTKFAETSACCLEDGKYHVQEIRIGGTNTKLVFKVPQQAAGSN